MLTEYLEKKFENYLASGRINKERPLGISTEQMFSMLRNEFGIKVSRTSLQQWIAAGVVDEPIRMEVKGSNKRGQRFFYGLKQVSQLIAVQRTLWALDFFSRRKLYDGDVKIDKVKLLKKFREQEVIDVTPPIQHYSDWEDVLMPDKGLTFNIPEFTNPVNKKLEIVYCLYRFYRVIDKIDFKKVELIDIYSMLYWWYRVELQHQIYYNKPIEEDVYINIISTHMKEFQYGDYRLQGVNFASPRLFLTLAFNPDASMDAAVFKSELPFIKEVIQYERKGIIIHPLFLLFKTTFFHCGLYGNNWIVEEFKVALEYLLNEMGIKSRPKDLQLVSFLLR